MILVALFWHKIAVSNVQTPVVEHAYAVTAACIADRSKEGKKNKQRINVTQPEQKGSISAFSHTHPTIA
jgi:hypothetical protein